MSAYRGDFGPFLSWRDSSGADAVLIFVPLRDGERLSNGHDVDPVCGRAFPSGSAVGRLVHAGVEYRFCSLACARKFACEPHRFTPRL